MMTFWRSMSGRVFLILLLGIVGAALLSLWLALGEQQRNIGQFRRLHAVERAEQLVRTFDALPRAERQPFLQGASRLGLPVELLPPSAAAQAASETTDSDFSSALAEHLGPSYRVRLLADASADCPMPHRRRNVDGAARRASCEVLGVTLRDGSLLRMTMFAPRNPPLLPPHTDFLSYLALFLVSIGILAYIVTRMTMRPLKQLAQAATELGHDLNRSPLALTGASEIRQASAAFNAMQERIRQHIAQRTEILAAITHDLQTPLTRLRLRLEKVQDSQLRERLVDDLAAMQALVREGLDLARSMDTAEPMQALDLDSLLDTVCADACDAGQDVTLSGHSQLSIMAHPQGLRRCLTNLIDNAVKYGQFARLTVQRGQDGAIIRIRDGGHGLAPDQLERVFEPFYRIESSRSRDTGGTGLGLSIARNIAIQHGGSLSLSNHPEGGLEVQLTLPRQAGALRKST